MLIECIPNVSEGRRADIVSALADAIRGVPGARLLDYSSDQSHHRSVFTFAGDRAQIKQAVMALVDVAVAAIDLRAHRGEHPRIGAVDVVPFVPLDGATMIECVEIANEVGAALARQFAIPVFLYEDAARRPGRRKLEDIRRGGFEGLARKMASPEWAPDYGPPIPHPTAGATAVGARMPLIAYNVNLATNRIEVARRIAATVRTSGGGLPSVKAMGVRLSDRHVVQVSMNLTNYRETSITRAFDAVQAQAAEEHVEVLESEIVGLVPAAALVDAVRSHLRLKGGEADHILEERLK